MKKQINSSTNSSFVKFHLCPLFNSHIHMVLVFPIRYIFLFTLLVRNLIIISHLPKFSETVIRLKKNYNFLDELNNLVGGILLFKIWK